jgi:hypothetical protein
MLFEHLAAQDAAEQEHKSGARAIIAANQRIAKSLSGYLSLGADASEYNARLAMVEPTVRSIVAAASEDHDADPETVFAAVVAGLRFACKECGCSDCGSDGGCSCKDCSSCGSKQSKLAHNGCTGEGCKFCENKFGQKDEEKDESDDMDVTAAVKWAVEVDTGDTFWSERVDLPKADASGLSSEGTPKIDKGRVPKDGLSAVDVPSSAHPSEMQDVAEKADYDTQTDQGANAKPDSTKAPVERVKADTPMQPEHHKAPRTKTWNGTEGLASPVTSKWAVEE